MKKNIYLLFVSFAFFNVVISQSTPNNVDLGIFNNGVNGSNAASSATLELALRIKPGGTTYTAIPNAEDFIIYVAVPKASFNGTEQMNLVQYNTAVYGATTMLVTQQIVDIGDPLYYYYGISLNGGSLNLNPLTLAWSFAFTMSFSPAPSTRNGIVIIDQNNNAFLSGVFGTTTFTRLLMLTQNQLTAASLTTLPVSFSNYDVKCNDKGSLLTWATTTEQNSDKFEIQRSTNGTDWVTVDNVAAAGNSNSLRSYQYLDLNGGTAFYRIRQVDTDGRFTYTSVKGTNCKTNQFDVTLYPVPAKDKLNVVIKSDKTAKTDLQILDVNGKTVRRMATQINKGNNNLILDVNDLPGGQYMLTSSDPSVVINKIFTVIR